MLFPEPELAGFCGKDGIHSSTKKGMRGQDRPIVDCSLLASFMHMARTDGERVAIIDGEIVMTYDLLHRRTNQFARILQKMGVCNGVLVGILMERSADLIVALLAVVKAGGAYVPLDPQYPETRLSQMIFRASPRVIITLNRHVSKLAASENAVLYCLDSNVSTIAQEADDDFITSVSPEDPLYVIFTSGSTGEPKGAIIQRKGFANLIEWFGEEFSICADDRILLLSSPSFDLTQKNFFTPLAAGATLICYPPGAFDLTSLIDLIERQKISVMNCTPSAFYPLIDPLNSAKMAKIISLRLVVLGGEPISIPRIRAWLQHEECSAEIANTYGPTECTDICAFYRLHRDNVDAFPFVPLGGTIPNVQLAVMNEKGGLSSAEEAGELVIGGAGVGLGYLGDSVRTDEKFIPNPFSPLLDGPKVYRTGDRVKLLPQGVFEFLGRVDHQVKLRGFRIELSEIETKLSSHPKIRESAVVMREWGNGMELMAFYLPLDSKSSLPPQDVRTFLSLHLPDYMVPRHIIALETFPLTPNGKVDRLRLAAMHIAASSGSSAPISRDLENTIHKLWKEILNQDSIGIDDNFFDLGGDSIQLARVHAQLTEIMHRSIPITDLFANPTVHSLADCLSGFARNSRAPAIKERAEKQRRALALRRSTHNL